MQELIVFNHLTMDGYFSGAGGDFSWAHRSNQDPEWDDFVATNAGSGGGLLFGRITYDIMTKYWPTPEAMKNNPVVARRMNELPKYVFSRTRNDASWSNTKVLKGNLAEEIRNLKQEPGKGLTLLGSGSIVAQLALEDVIDEYQLILNPVVLGKGRTLFEGISKKLPLGLVSTRGFRNGNVLMTYRPVLS